MNYLDKALAAKEKMRETAQQWEECKAGIRGDDDYTPEAKNRLVEESRPRFAGAYKEHKAAYHAALERGEKELAQKLFRASFFDNDVVAQRDAFDRARRADNKELLSLLDEAILLGTSRSRPRASRRLWRGAWPLTQARRSRTL